MNKNLLLKDFDLDECVYMRQLSFLLLKVDKKNNKLTVIKSNKFNYLLIFVCIVEIIKNFYYLITPMTDIRRFYFSDLVSSTKGNFIIFQFLNSFHY